MLRYPAQLCLYVGTFLTTATTATAARRSSGTNVRHVRPRT
jgi:hypothetical protein